MYKLGLEKAEEPEIKLPTSFGSCRKQRNSRKTSTSVSLTMLNVLTVWINTNCGKCLKRWEYQTTLPVSEKPVCRSRSNSQNRWNNWLVPNWERSTTRLYIVALLTYLTWKIHHVKCQAGWIPSWNKMAGGNINDLKYADDTTLMAESEEEIKSLLMRMKEESE